MTADHAPTDPGPEPGTHLAPELDTVLVEVIGSALATIVEEMSGTLVRAAFSTNIKERRDCTAGLFDAAGKGIAQDEGGSPLHLGSLMGIVDSILERFPPEEIQDGDTFIGNDPHNGGGSHLPDIVLATPIFVAGELTAWAATLAHHADFGDRGHAHIFQEGLRIPPVRLVRAGVMQEEMLSLILLNCQVPHERRADLRAQSSANRLAVQRYRELCGRYGTRTVVRAGAELLDFNIGTSLIGSTAGLVAVWLHGLTGTDVAFGWYMTGACVVSILVTIFALPASVDYREPDWNQAALPTRSA